MPPLLEVKNLKTSFYTGSSVVKAVNDVSFDLYEGETVGIVGESGCGKSVTAMSILRLIPFPPGKIIGGQVLFMGEDLLQLGDEQMREIRGNHIAMVFQEPMTSFNPVLTIGYQVAEPIIIHKKRTLKEALGEVVHLLERVKIPEARLRVSDYPHQFSGGMRQRSMIAMGLGCTPKLLIADEPTTALDVTVQAQLLELMKGLTQDFSMALILITHNLGVVSRYADRVNIMYAGRIVEKGTVEDVYLAPQHPYTIGLMNSVPKIDQDMDQKLMTIEGQPPNLAHLPPGCPFHPRCSHSIERCRQEVPVLELISEKHEKACWVNVRA
jgi:oligopeptide transport system ATP-binding protein